MGEREIIYLVNMVLNVHRNHKAYYNIKDGRRGYGGGGKREIIYLSLHSHHQNDYCTKMGKDESHFNVSLIVRDKVTRQCPQTTTFEEKESRSGFEPRPLCLPALRRSSPRFGCLFSDDCEKRVPL